jgi:hypothetical protein
MTPRRTILTIAASAGAAPALAAPHKRHPRPRVLAASAGVVRHRRSCVIAPRTTRRVRARISGQTSGCGKDHKGSDYRDIPPHVRGPSSGEGR